MFLLALTHYLLEALLHAATLLTEMLKRPELNGAIPPILDSSTKLQDLQVTEFQLQVILQGKQLVMHCHAE